MKLSTLLPCEKALVKLFNYGYLPARQMFYLANIKRQVIDALESYHNARNAMLMKYGTSGDGQKYDITGENIAAYQSELDELNKQDIGFDFDENKLVLCVESIEKSETGLPPEKRLGFSANDWAAIQGIIKVVETEG